ncbi:COX15-CtaA-domain-containing protein [Serendipita vermifera]|nr:COX15-CtaA-domain-containing protein [Serendipita vermifera]
MSSRNGAISRLGNVLQISRRIRLRPETSLINRLAPAGRRCERSISVLAINATSQTRQFPDFFTPSYPSYFFPNRFYSSPQPTGFVPNSEKRKSVEHDNKNSQEQLPPKWVSKWLFLCSGLTLGVIVVGGVTRLTESGLSITEWKPITGVLPPMNAQAWEEEFLKYKETPEFKMLNSKMNVDEFKSIFYMEWGHRILGRVIGLAFIVPYGYLLATRKLSAPTAGKLGFLGLLLGFQGALGWYMVKSGLDHRILEKGEVPRVSQYRLAAHLGAALLFFMGTLRLGLSAKKDIQWASGAKVNGVGDAFISLLQDPRIRRFKWASAALLTLAFTTAISGAFVAGLDAGLLYNEFPYMGHSLMPPVDEMFSKAYSQTVDGSDVWWRNLFENPTTVQFDHRLLAMTTYFSTALLYAGTRFSSLHAMLPPTTRHLVGASFGMVNIQAALGISTLLYLVPIPLAASHQAGSVALLTALVALVTSLRRPSAAATALRLVSKVTKTKTPHVA